MHGHELVEHLFPLRPPKNKEVAALMDNFRAEFTDLAHDVVSHTAITPEQTIAIRKIHEACQATITAIALNQEGY